MVVNWRTIREMSCITSCIFLFFFLFSFFVIHKGLNYLLANYPFRPVQILLDDLDLHLLFQWLVTDKFIFKLQIMLTREDNLFWLQWSFRTKLYVALHLHRLFNFPWLEAWRIKHLTQYLNLLNFSLEDVSCPSIFFAIRSS